MPDPREPSVPQWLRYRGKTFSRTLSVVNKAVSTSGIATVCKEARCPNRTECWSSGTATFMLMGDTCTRSCRFCAVKTSASPAPLNPDEPQNLVEAIQDWNLSYVVLTSVDRDDLPDGGSSHLAQCVRAVKNERPDLLVEILIPDFNGDAEAIQNIVDAKPDVISHNIETVARLQKKVRDRRANYEQSLHVLQTIKELDPTIYTKSSIMVGLGERDEEIIQTMKDLLDVGVSFLTIGQYMRPTLKNLRVKEYISPDKFKDWKERGLELGFLYVASGPLVRSSYKAGEFFIENILKKH